MRKWSKKQRERELKAIAALPEQDVDISDIPELSEDLLRQGVRGLMYRPVKKPVTMRLDADVLAWLKAEGPGYQTKANALLRKEMIRSYQQKKQPAAVRAREGMTRKKQRHAK
jgi:uncharacterized protein (DUF4415 family)